jgi:CoA:oxalate CoA-transferase
MAQPLAGVRIADFSHVIAGPLATQFLCLLGAEVIKIEPPSGDAMRYYTRTEGRHGMAEPFVAANAGKKSVVLDLKTEEGREAAHRIISTSDIMVENFRPGVADRLGFGASEVTKRNPCLIYCSVSGFGQTGPMANYPAIDQVIQSVSGLMLLSGQEGDPAERIGFPIVDTYSALLTAFAILAAYTQRQADTERRGQVVDVSMLDATLVMMSSVVAPMLISGIAPKRSGNRGFSGVPTADTFVTADGEITIGAVQDIQVERLFSAMGRSELLNDTRFESHTARLNNDKDLQEELSSTFSLKSAEEWESILTNAGVPAGKVRNLAEALDLPQLENRNLFIDVPDRRACQRSIKVPNAGFKFSRSGPKITGGAPELGEHTEEVLTSFKDASPK